MLEVAEVVFIHLVQLVQEVLAVAVQQVLAVFDDWLAQGLVLPAVGKKASHV